MKYLLNENRNEEKSIDIVYLNEIPVETIVETLKRFHGSSTRKIHTVILSKANFQRLIPYLVVVLLILAVRGGVAVRGGGGGGSL